MILAIDTATRLASIALYDEQGVHAEQTWRSRDHHTVELAPNIALLLRGQQVQPRDLAGLAVALGPGSFNGLRVGLSMAKGLALAADLPLVGVPTLDIIAHAHARQSLPVCAIIQAGRARIGTATYQPAAGAWSRLAPDRLTTIEALCKDIRQPTLFCGEIRPEDAALLRSRLGARAVIASPAASLRRAGYLAELGWQRLVRGEADGLASLTPIYLQNPSL